MNFQFADKRRQVLIVAAIVVILVVVVGLGLGGSSKKTAAPDVSTVDTTDSIITFDSTTRSEDTTTTTEPLTPAPSPAGSTASVPLKGLKGAIAANKKLTQPGPKAVAPRSLPQVKVPISHAPKPATSHLAKVPTSTTPHKKK